MQNIDGFEIIQQIGQGATSLVFKAIQISMQREVAIKVLRPELGGNPEMQKRFIAEARSVAKLSHPNIIKGISVGQTKDNLAYFVMEYVAGNTGLQLIKKYKKIPEKYAISIIKQMALALEHAHEQNMVHKDIKPDNILITKKFKAKLCDLGLVNKKIEKDTFTGTPYYISPEQARGDNKIDIRSDIYSLGITGYHFATGKVPFGGTPMIVLSKHLTNPIPHPKKVNPELSDKFCNLLLKMLKKDPDERYDNPTALVSAMEKEL